MKPFRLLINLRSSLALTAALFLFAATHIAEAAGLSGTYRVEGRNPNGSAYSGTVTIEDDGFEVRMHWRVGRTYSGTGTREGRVLTVNWGASAPVIYVVNPDGTLYGTWARGRALELLTPQ